MLGLISLGDIPTTMLSSGNQLNPAWSHVVAGGGGIAFRASCFSPSSLSLPSPFLLSALSVSPSFSQLLHFSWQLPRLVHVPPGYYGLAV